MSGSRAVVRLNCSGESVINLVRELDARPGRFGLELWQFLSQMVIVQGISIGPGRFAPKREAHGVGCLAAQLVVHLKKGVGDIYLEPVARIDYDQDWEYIVSFEDDSKDLREGNPVMRVLKEGTPVFEGTMAEFHTYCNADFFS